MRQKRLINNNPKEKVSSNRIINHRRRHRRCQFKKKTKKNNLSKEHFRTNWIENESDDESFVFNRKKIIYNQMKSKDDDEDSLQLENLQYLSTMKNILFLDLENFSRFFEYLTKQLPNHTYLFAFHSSNIQWKPPINNRIFEDLFDSNHFHLMYPSGHRHDAADFALVLTFGKLHGLLNKSIPFTIISGDKGFLEIIHQLKTSHRIINWFNPHQISFEHFYRILSIQY